MVSTRSLVALNINYMKVFVVTDCLVFRQVFLVLYLIDLSGNSSFFMQDFVDPQHSPLIITEYWYNKNHSSKKIR